MADRSKQTVANGRCQRNMRLFSSSHNIQGFENMFNPGNCLFQVDWHMALQDSWLRAPLCQPFRESFSAIPSEISGIIRKFVQSSMWQGTRIRHASLLSGECSPLFYSAFSCRCRLMRISQSNGLLILVRHPRTKSVEPVCSKEMSSSPTFDFL